MFLWRYFGVGGVVGGKGMYSGGSWNDLMEAYLMPNRMRVLGLQIWMAI